MGLMAANHLHLPGVTGNFVWVPGIANLDGTGTLEFIAKVNLDDWTPDANQIWISKWTGSAGYLFYLESASNDLKLIWRDSGPARIAQATETPTVTDGDWLWVRAVATEDGVDRDVFFYTSTDETNNPDEVTWTQLGAEVVVPFGGGDLTTNTAVVFVGAQSATVATMAGSIAAARVNFAGVTQLDIDFTDLTTAEVDAGSFTEDSSNAATVTIAGTAWAYVRPRILNVYPKTTIEGSTRTVTVKVFDQQTGIVSRFVHIGSGVAAEVSLIGLKYVFDLIVPAEVTDQDIDNALYMDDIEPGKSAWAKAGAMINTIIGGLPGGYDQAMFWAGHTKPATAAARADIDKALVIQRGWVIVAGSMHQHEGDGTSVDF